MRSNLNDKFLFLRLPQVEEVIIETFCGFAIMLSFGPLFLYLSRNTAIPNPFAAYGEFFMLLLKELGMSSLFVIGIAAPSLGFLLKPLAMMSAKFVCSLVRLLRWLSPHYFLCKIHHTSPSVFDRELKNIYDPSCYIEHPCFGHLGTKLHPPYRTWLLASDMSDYWQWEHFLLRFYTRATGLTFMVIIAWIIAGFVSHHYTQIQIKYYLLFIILLLILLYFLAGTQLFQHVVFKVTDLYLFGEFMKKNIINEFAENKIVDRFKKIREEKLTLEHYIAPKKDRGLN